MFDTRQTAAPATQTSVNAMRMRRFDMRRHLVGRTQVVRVHFSGRAVDPIGSRSQKNRNL